MRCSALALLDTACFAPGIPAGFTPLFDGKTLAGWVISEVNHHGNTKAWKMENGVVSVTQDPPGNGGILLTNQEYGNFELSLEVKPDFGCDGGVFLRSTVKGEAYQVMVDYFEGGVMGGIYGERIPDVNAPGNGTGMRLDRDWARFWKKDDWNHLRIRITGEIPHIEVWINGNQTADFTDSQNHGKTGTARGHIALQAHRSNPAAKNSRWVPGGFHRFRNIAIRELL
ncbi:MAG: DUF1080 domain-containing protein [Acidobacteriota bacterium]